MEIEEAKERRAALETKLLIQITQFEKETKLTVAAISLKHVQNFAQPARVVELGIDVRI